MSAREMLLPPTLGFDQLAMGMRLMCQYGEKADLPARFGRRGGIRELGRVPVACG
jgi:hypothetical protein